MTSLFNPLIFYGILSLFTLVHGELACPSEWKLYYKGETCVRSFGKSESKKTWDDARKACQDLNGDLIRIDDTPKLAMFNEMMANTKGQFWIGLRRTNTRATTFRWLDDKTSISKDRKTLNWRIGEPKKYGRDLDCASTFHGAGLIVTDCGHKINYVCEKAAFHTAPEICPEGWTMYNKICYRVYQEKKNWHYARTTCFGVKSDLASILDSATTNFIKSKFKHTDYWIGLNNLIKSDQYIWSYNRDELGKYTNWDSDQTGDTRNSHCVVMSASKQKWIKTDCMDENFFICQRHPENDKLLCPLGYDFYNKEKTCLMMYSKLLNWDDARWQCKKNTGSDLVKITDVDKHKFIQRLLRSRPYKYWIGLHKKANSDKLIWLDEVPKASYSKAKASEHDNDSCFVVQGNNDEWENDNCKGTKHFALCERKAYTSIACPPGYFVKMNTYTCVKVSKDVQPWENARTICQMDKGDLVAITDDHSNMFIRSLVFQSSMNPVWIGLHDRLKDDHFQWLDEKEKDKARDPYRHWASGQPNDTEGILNCVHMSNVDGQWYDGDCSEAKRYICERTATIKGLEPPPDSSLTLICPKGWTKSDKHGETCVKYNSDLKTWKNARKTCQKTGGDLVKIDNNDIAGLINALLVIENNAKVNPYIGLNDLSKNGQFAWLDETKETTFKYWHEGEPSGANNHCVYIMVGKNIDSEWKATNCDTKLGYICQQPATPPGSVNCGPGWEDSPDSDYCYGFNKEILNWHEARNSCKVKGGDLLSVRDANEMFYLVGRLQSVDGDTFWSGGNDRTINTGWQWTDHQPFAFYNWDIDEPNSNQSKSCILVNKKTGRWNAASCRDHKPSICKKLGNVINHPTPAPTAPPTNLASSLTWACPIGWSSFRGSCYRLHYVHSGVTWYLANQICHKESANLVAITDDQENDFLLSYLPKGHTNTWIGLNDFKRRLSFSWSDGVTPMTYTNWMWKQPHMNGVDKVCVAISNFFGKWADFDCNRQNELFFCKRNKSVRSNSERDKFKGCKKRGVGYYDRCFQFISNSKTFDNAQKECQKSGGNLATLNDRYSQAFVAAHMKIGRTHWIGLSNTKLFGTSYVYTWQSGGKFDYTYWGRGHTGKETSTCVAMDRTRTTSFWKNYSCTKQLGFVCEYPRPGYTTPQTFTTTPTLLPCPTGWTPVNDMCYKAALGQKNLKSWMGAKSYCESAVTTGGTLASLTSKALEIQIKKTMFKRIVGIIWIGLNDRDEEGGYRWAGGEPFNYENWKSLEPSHWDKDGDCVLWKMTYYSPHGWKVSHCSAANNFLCQAPRGAQSITTLTPPSIGPTATQCGTGGTWTMYDSYCYILTKTNYHRHYTWFKARDECHKLGAELVSIADSEENGYLITLMGQNLIKNAWIGLSDLDENIYKWADGSPLTFLSWAQNEPNDYRGYERCGMMYSNGKWNDHRCDKDLPYICKKRPGDFSPITPSSTSAPKGGCPAGFYGMPGTSRCFMVTGIKEADRKSFLDANQACRKLPTKSRLTSIHSTMDEDFLTTLISNLDVPAWIGFETESMSIGASYFWVDNSQINYVHWGPSQPSSGENSYYNVKKCTEIMIKPKSAGDWSAESCDTKLPYVCEADKSTIFPLNGPNTEGCQTGYLRFKDSCYKYIPTLQNWKASEATCVQDGGHLASEQGGFEKSYIDLILQTHQQDQLWIGLSDNAGKNAFTWSDHWPVIYTAWGENQPDLTKQCVSHTQNSTWSTMDCTIALPSVCQINLVASPPATPIVPGKCPSNIWTQYGEYCYYIDSGNMKSWPEASFMCDTIGGELASIHNEDEAKLIAKIVNVERADAWIGLRRSGKDSSFTWADNTEVEYFNWATGSPATSVEGQSCALVQGMDGKWSDNDCFDSIGYICKAKQIPLSTPSTSTTTTTTTTTASSTTTTSTTSSNKVAMSSKRPRESTSPRKSNMVTHLPPGNPSHSKQTNNSASLGTSGIASIVVGIVCFLALVVIGVLLFKRYKTRSNSTEAPSAGFENSLYDATIKAVELQLASST